MSTEQTKIIYLFLSFFCYSSFKLTLKQLIYNKKVKAIIYYIKNTSVQLDLTLTLNP